LSISNTIKEEIGAMKKSILVLMASLLSLSVHAHEFSRGNSSETKYTYDFLHENSNHPCDKKESVREQAECHIRENKAFFSTLGLKKPSFTSTFIESLKDCYYTVKTEEQLIRVGNCRDRDFNGEKCILISVKENKVDRYNKIYSNLLLGGFHVKFEAFEAPCLQ
jgi:hypothetical protein